MTDPADRNVAAKAGVPIAATPKASATGPADPTSTASLDGRGDPVSPRSSDISRVVLVVGMHRSGTSAITKAVSALGVALGDDLMPGVTDNNEKGFWEDREFSAINDEILAASGLLWDSLLGPRIEELQSARLEPQRSRARRLLSERQAQHRVCGYKDPRAARLLGFWLPLIAELGVRADLVFSIRNPRAVARSLHRRDAMPSVKAYQLWLSHTVSAFCDARDLRALVGRRVVVSFERLLDDSPQELARIAGALDVDFDPEAGEVLAFSRDFIDPTLEHGRDDTAQLMADRMATGNVALAFAAVESLSRNSPEATWQHAEEQLAAIRESQQAYAPLLDFAVSADRDARRLRKAHADALTEIAVQQNVRADREATIAVLSRTVDTLGNEVKAGMASLDAAVRGVMHDASRSADVEQSLRHSLESAHRRSEDDARELRAARETVQRLELESDVLRAALGDAERRAEVEGSRREAALENQRVAGERIVQLHASLRRASAELAQLSRKLLEVEAERGSQEQEFSRRIRELERELAQQKVAATTHMAALDHAKRGNVERLKRALAGPVSLLRLLRPSEWRTRLDVRSIRQSGLFDLGWYLGANADVAARGLDPIEHYVRHGAAEFRDPSRGFSTRWYLNQYPDVARARVNPLAHFVRSGVHEGRSPQPPSRDDTGARAR